MASALDTTGYIDQLSWQTPRGQCDQRIWKLAPERSDSLRAAARRVGMFVNWGVYDRDGAVTGGSALTLPGAIRKARRAFAREAAARSAA